MAKQLNYICKLLYIARVSGMPIINSLPQAAGFYRLFVRTTKRYMAEVLRSQVKHNSVVHLFVWMIMAH